jgi:hypothetical protein
MPDPKPHELDCDLYTSTSSHPFPKGSTVHLHDDLAKQLVSAKLAHRVPTEAEAQATAPVPAEENAEEHAAAG